MRRRDRSAVGSAARAAGDTGGLVSRKGGEICSASMFRIGMIIRKGRGMIVRGLARGRR